MNLGQIQHLFRGEQVGPKLVPPSPAFILAIHAKGGDFLGQLFQYHDSACMGWVFPPRSQ